LKHLLPLAPRGTVIIPVIRFKTVRDETGQKNNDAPYEKNINKKKTALGVCHNIQKRPIEENETDKKQKQMKFFFLKQLSEHLHISSCRLNLSRTMDPNSWNADFTIPDCHQRTLGKISTTLPRYRIKSRLQSQRRSCPF
jgi:hypothetical protein